MTSTPGLHQPALTLRDERDLLALWLAARNNGYGDTERAVQAELFSRGIWISRVVNPNIDVGELENRLWQG